jgi:hypothetical protein
VLKNDAIDLAGGDQFEAAGVGWMGDTALPFEQDHCRMFVDPGLVDGVFDLTR